MILLSNSTIELQKVKGTFTFNMTIQLSLKEFEAEYNVRILPAAIIGGRRWSFTGKLTGDIPPGQSERIAITKESGVIVYNWHSLDSNKQQELRAKIMRITMDVS
jgi:hypothetical protein